MTLPEVPSMEFVKEIAEETVAFTLQLPRPARGQALAYAGDLETVVVEGEPWTRAASNADVDGVEVFLDTQGNKWRRKLFPELSLRNDFQMRAGRDETEAWTAAIEYIRVKGGGTLVVDDLFTISGTGPNTPSFLTLRSPAFAARLGASGGYQSRYGLDGGGAAGQFLTWTATDHVENVRLMGVVFKNRQRYLAGPNDRYLARWRVEECSFHRSCEVAWSGNPYYLRMINNLLGYEGAAGAAFQALNFVGSPIFPGNKNMMEGNHIYGGAGASPVVSLTNQRQLILEGENYEQNRGAGVLKLTDCQHVKISGAWFELNGASNQIEAAGNSDHIHLRDLEYVSHRDNQAFFINTTGRDLDLAWEGGSPLLLGRYTLPGGSLKDVRLTQDHIGYDRAFGRYVAPRPTRVHIDTSAAGFDPYSQTGGSTGTSAYPYTIAAHGADGLLRLGVVGSSSALTAPTPPTLAPVASAPALTPAATPTTTVYEGLNHVIVQRDYTVTPGSTGDVAYQIGNIPTGWKLALVGISYGSFTANGHGEYAEHHDLIHVTNTNTLGHQLRVKFTLVPV